MLYNKQSVYKHITTMPTLQRRRSTNPSRREFRAAVRSRRIANERKRQAAQRATLKRHVLKRLPISEAGKRYNAVLYRPFDPKTVPAQIPDMWRGHSIAICLEKNHVSTIGADGVDAMWFSPRLDEFMQTAQTFVSGSVTVWNAKSSHPDWTTGLSISTNISRYRVLCLAVRATYTGRTDAKAGRCTWYLNNHDEDPSGDIADYNRKGSMNGSHGVGNGPITIISRPFDRPNFGTETDAGLQKPERYMNDVVVGFTGLTSGSTVTFEVKVYLEMQPLAGTLLADLGTDAPHDPNVSVTASSVGYQATPPTRTDSLTSAF
jgi:hypothetical protein